MSTLRLEDGVCPAQGYVETLLWNWEFSLDLFGPKPFIILCWHSVDLQGSVKAPVMWKKFAVSLIETRHLATMRHWRTVCWEVTLLPYQGSFLYGIHLVLSPAVSGWPCSGCSLGPKHSSCVSFLGYLSVTHPAVLLLAYLPIKLWAGTKSWSVLYPQHVTHCIL